VDEDLTPILEKCVEWGALDARAIPTSSVAVGTWVRLKCQYGCPNYGQRLDCPPNTPGPDVMRQLLAEYKRAIILKLRRRDSYRPEWSGIVLKVERELFLGQFYRAFALGAGACGYCQTECVRQAGKCPKPQNIRPAAEGMGVDWFQTLRNCGWNVSVLVDRPEEGSVSYSLILVD